MLAAACSDENLPVSHDEPSVLEDASPPDPSDAFVDMDAEVDPLQALFSLRLPTSRMGITAVAEGGVDTKVWYFRLYPANDSRVPEESRRCDALKKVENCFVERCLPAKADAAQSDVPPWSGTIELLNETSGRTSSIELESLNAKENEQLIVPLSTWAPAIGDEVRLRALAVSGLPPIDVKFVVPPAVEFSIEDHSLSLSTTRAFTAPSREGTIRLDMNQMNQTDPFVNVACFFDGSLRSHRTPSLGSIGVECGGPGLWLLPVGLSHAVVEAESLRALVYIGVARLDMRLNLAVTCDP